MTPRSADPEPVRAAGAVLWRSRNGRVEVALVHRARYDDWSFPKGKLDPGEPVLRAAVREVEEETGARPRLGARLSSVRYLKGGRPKEVDYWAATPGPGSVAFAPNDEVDRLDWLPIEQAIGRLSYEHDRQLLGELTAGALTAVPHVVLRHGSAGDKHSWTGDGALRPLDPRGREEAAEVARLLAAFGPFKVVSSPSARCLETVLPYVLGMDLPVTTDRAFAVDRAAPRAAADRFTELVSEATATLVCTHGEVVGGLLEDVCTRLGGKPPDDPGLRKGGFWVLHVAAGALVAVEQHQAVAVTPS